MPPPKLVSIVMPVYNEAKALPELFERLKRGLSLLRVPYEVILVDDGSRDGSFQKILELSKNGAPVVAIELRRNFGQTAALAAGIEAAEGDVIVTLDSDLENDPTEIVRFVDKLAEGYDVVSGWRQDRWQGSFITRKIPSLAANWIISKLSGVHLHDYGCTFKAYRADMIKGVRLYGDMHRFIAAYAVWQGGRIVEIPVRYTPRKFGKSNYGLGRIFRVLLDLVVVVFIHRYMNRPMHFFGAWGFVSLVLGFVAGSAALVLRFFGIHMVQTPLPVLATLLLLVGVQLVLFGVIAEILMRTYYESQQKRPYTVRQTVRGE